MKEELVALLEECLGSWEANVKNQYRSETAEQRDVIVLLRTLIVGLRGF